MFRHFDKIDDYTKGYIAALLAMQKQIYGADLIERALTGEIIDKIRVSAPMYASGDGLEDDAWIFSKYFISRELTKIERNELLVSLSQKLKVTLYTHEPTPELQFVDNRGPIDYFAEMPLAIKCAKINLNISLRSIVTGIPLRVMDIFGCGGFVLTDYRADMNDIFVPKVDYDYFENEDDLFEKCAYYLSHEEERKEIAANGYAKAKANHTLRKRFDTIDNIVFGE